MTSSLTVQKGTTILLRVVAFMVIIAIFIFVLFPFYWMLKSSFQRAAEILAAPPRWFPSSLSLEPYRTALTVVPLMRYFVNSLINALSTAVIATLVATSAAYVLARYRFRGRALILWILLFSQLIPIITRVIPIYFLLQSLGLIGTYQGLITAYVSFAMPFTILMLRGYFEAAYPPELEDAALIDGCTLFGVFWRIVLPLAIPGVIAVATYSFILAWNDFLWASIITYKGSMRTLQVGLRDFIGEFGNLGSINAFMAACVVATIPTVILFRFVEKYMVQGITAGAVKG